MIQEAQAEIDHYWYLKESWLRHRDRNPVTARMLEQEMTLHVRHLLGSGIVKPGQSIPKVSHS